MLIDWFTVGAQLLNFLILVWLLKHFLYKPILDAIGAREKRIAAEIADAAAEKSAAGKEREELRSKNQAIDEQRSTLLGNAVKEAAAERARLLAQAAKEADGLRSKNEDAIRNDQKRLADAITRLAAEEVFGIVRKVLGDLASATLEERMGDVFIRRLREMDAKVKEPLAAAARTSSEPTVVRSTFDMPAGERAAMQNALNESFSAEIRVNFETAAAAICGIELTAGGQKLGWNIADYLGALEQKVGLLLDARGTPAPQTAGTT
jgi:F-type H+-transporting ATPase subunit b